MTAEIEPRVVETLRALGVPYELVPIDPDYADTAAFCARYGVPLEREHAPGKASRFLIAITALISAACTTDTVHEVEYIVHTAGYPDRGPVNIHYINETGASESRGHEQRPWRKEFKARKGSTLSVLASGPGVVACTITVDGKVVQTAKLDNIYRSIATCSGKL